MNDLTHDDSSFVLDRAITFQFEKEGGMNKAEILLRLKSIFDMAMTDDILEEARRATRDPPRDHHAYAYGAAACRLEQIRAMASRAIEVLSERRAS